MTETYGGHPQTGAKHNEFVDISGDHDFPPATSGHVVHRLLLPDCFKPDTDGDCARVGVPDSPFAEITCAPAPGPHGCRCLGARNARRHCGPPGLFRRSSRGKFIPKRFCRRMKRIYHRAVTWLRTAKFRDRDNRRYKCFRHLLRPSGFQSRQDGAKRASAQ